MRIVLQGFDPSLPTRHIIWRGPAAQWLNDARYTKCEGGDEDVNKAKAAAEKERPLERVSDGSQYIQKACTNLVVCKA